MRRIIVSIIVALSLLAGNAMAESIKGRLGITGQLGFIIPNDSELTPAFANANGLASRNLKADGAFAGGGGLILGLSDNWAVEAHVLHMPDLDYKGSNGTRLEISSTDASLGIQLRNNVSDDLTAYLGGGVDVLLSEGNIDTVVGGHINVGGDYFITKNVALNIDIRGVFFPKANVNNGGTTVAEYDPIAYLGLIGVRFFLF